MRTTILITLILAMAMLAGCHSASAGHYSVETSCGKVETIHPPGETYTTFGYCAAANDVDGIPWTVDVPVHTATKDNAPLKLTVRVQGRVDPNHVGEFFTKFGADAKSRETKINEFITGATATAGRDAIVQHDAYGVYAAQDEIQQVMAEKLKEYMATQMFCEFQAVQIIDKPTFDNQAIEDAASQVVAAQKLKQAAEQQKQAAQTILDKNQIENQIYASSPQAFEIKKLEIQKEIAQAWAGHQGSLFFGSGSGVQIQVPGGK